MPDSLTGCVQNVLKFPLTHVKTETSLEQLGPHVQHSFSGIFISAISFQQFPPDEYNFLIKQAFFTWVILGGISASSFSRRSSVASFAMTAAGRVASRGGVLGGPWELSGSALGMTGALGATGALGIIGGLGMAGALCGTCTRFKIEKCKLKCISACFLYV